MPCLKYIIQNANTPELKMLRGKTIECVSLIGLAVGKDKVLESIGEKKTCENHKYGAVLRMILLGSHDFILISS